MTLLAGCFDDELPVGSFDGPASCTFGPEVDSDGDGICDGADRCPGDDDLDADGDGICDALDTCEGGADDRDQDGDGVCDFLDQCPGGDDAADADGDRVCDSLDRCPDADDRFDIDADGIPDCLDDCNFDGPEPPPLVDLPAGPARFGPSIDSITLDGSGRFVEASPGQVLRVSLEVVSADCDCADRCPHQGYLGFAEQQGPQLCIFDDLVGCAPVRETVELEIAAPAVPGEYALRMSRGVDAAGCALRPWTEAAQLAPLDDIAIVCVR